MSDSIEFTDEELMAHADGELPPARAAALEAGLAADAGLRQRLAPYAQTRAALRSAFASTLEAPLPARLQALFTADTAMPMPIDLPKSLMPPRHQWRRPTTWALAASLLLAIGLGFGLRQMQHTGTTASMVAQATLQPDAGLLNRALEAQASGDPLTGKLAERSEEIMPVSTLRTADGRYCRLFDATYQQGQNPPRHAHGLACRQAQAQWQLLATIDADAAAQPAADRYITAGAGGPELQGLLPGAAPLTPQAEAALIEGSWR